MAAYVDGRVMVDVAVGLADLATGRAVESGTDLLAELTAAIGFPGRIRFGMTPDETRDLARTGGRAGP